MTSPQETAVAAFRNHFNADPAYVARAPGRVNLIGEHTDYNDGFVLPLAIDRATWIALRPRADQTVWVHSLNLEETAVFSLDQFDHADDWSEYLRGMAWALQEAGYALSGWEGMLISDVPIGAGLSSSAALEMAVARAFQAASGWEWAPARMAQICRRADNGWVGIQSGIMDQMISASGQAGAALLIDCRTLATQPALLPPATAVVILDTNTRRGLVDSAYNERRAQCAAAAAFFGVPALRDVDLAQFDARAAGLDELSRRRARHVITENARTLEAVAAMRRGDAAALGALMDASHASLRDDFDVSSAALNAIVACARRQPACYGARMTGAGFGGCAVALVDAAAVEAFSAAVDPCYRAATGQAPTLYACRPAAGATVEAFGLSC